MKLAIFFGPFCLGNGSNGFDFGRLYSDPRGLSGSEIGFFRVGQELASLGHHVTLYTFPKPGGSVPPELSPGVSLRHYDARTEVTRENGFDAAVSWNESEPLLAVGEGVLRVVSLQINSLVSSTRAIESVDLWLSPSESHRRMMLTRQPTELEKMRYRNVATIDERFPPGCSVVGDWWRPSLHLPDPRKWEVVPDGCDPEVFDKLMKHGAEKISGRAIWCSSPDRGLHWLLSIWPSVRRAVPHAHLRVFYHLQSWLKHMLEQDPIETDHSIREQIFRARYIDEVLGRLGPNSGIDLFDSVSRRRISEEQATAQITPYTCDPPGIWTEGFSCSLMECCAARSGVIVPETDALGEVYAELDCVPRPSLETIVQFEERVIRMLSDEKYRSEQNEIGRSIAERFTWKKAALRMSEVLSNRLASGAP